MIGRALWWLFLHYYAPGVSADEVLDGIERVIAEEPAWGRPSDDFEGCTE